MTQIELHDSTIKDRS